MKSLTFTKQGNAYISEPFGGGVILQLASKTATAIINIDTCISAEMGWAKAKSVMLNGASEILPIVTYATDQVFRLRSRTEVSAVISDIASSQIDSAKLAELVARIEELEDGQDPLVLTINDDGDLEQTGVSSGTFGVNDEGEPTFNDKE